MTTIGVRPFPGQRVLPLDFPSYHYHHPSIQAFTLGMTGEGVFRPMLPTHRRMEMDSVVCLDEPNRPVAKCTRDDFLYSKTSLYPPIPGRAQPAAGITRIGWQVFKHHNAPDELRPARLAWSEFLNRSPERYKIRLHELPENCCKDLEFSGFAVRYMRPGVDASWRRPLSRYIPTHSSPTCQRCEEARSHLPF